MSFAYTILRSFQVQLILRILQYFSLFNTLCIFVYNELFNLFQYCIDEFIPIEN